VIGQDDKETTAIKAVIERETAAYFQTDYKGWMDCWVHAPYSYWCVADSTGFNTFEGWKAIEIGFTDYFVTSKPSTTTFARKWNSIRIYGTGAYANFVQLTTLDGVTVAEDELRVLEKQNNKWKIVLVMVGHKKGN
jgi:hypothetical protein